MSKFQHEIVILLQHMMAIFFQHKRTISGDYEGQILSLKDFSHFCLPAYDYVFPFECSFCNGFRVFCVQSVLVGNQFRTECAIAWMKNLHEMKNIVNVKASVLAAFHIYIHTQPIKPAIFTGSSLLRGIRLFW